VVCLAVVSEELLWPFHRDEPAASSLFFPLSWASCSDSDTLAFSHNKMYFSHDFALIHSHLTSESRNTKEHAYPTTSLGICAQLTKRRNKTKNGIFKVIPGREEGCTLSKNVNMTIPKVSSSFFFYGLHSKTIQSQHSASTLLSLYCFGVEAFTTTTGFSGGKNSMICFQTV
jgi:hypothetical protein